MLILDEDFNPIKETFLTHTITFLEQKKTLSDGK